MEQLTTYKVTFKETKDEWLFQYRADGLLYCFINLKGKSFINLLRKQTFPESKEMMEQWTKYKNIVTIELVLEDYSFESFWEKYNLKQKRELSEKAFNKLTLVDKIKSFNKLASYDAYITAKGINKALMVTWINQKRFNDEY